MSAGPAASGGLVPGGRAAGLGALLAAVAGAASAAEAERTGTYHLRLDPEECVLRPAREGERLACIRPDHPTLTSSCGGAL